MKSKKSDFDKGIELLYGGDKKNFDRLMEAEAKRFIRSRRPQGRS